MKGNCAECEYRWTCEIDPDECDEWPDHTPMTNEVAIRAMSSSRFVEFLCGWADSKAWKQDPGSVEAWLQEPANEDGGQ